MASSTLLREMAQRTAEEERLTEQIRAHLRRLIRIRFKTPYGLAKQTGIPSSTVYHILSGNRGVGIDVLYALHKGLVRSADEFLDEVPEQKYFERGSEYGPEGPRRGRRPSLPAEDDDPPARPAARQGTGR